MLWLLNTGLQPTRLESLSARALARWVLWTEPVSIALFVFAHPAPVATVFRTAIFPTRMGPPKCTTVSLVPDFWIRRVNAYAFWLCCRLSDLMLKRAIIKLLNEYTTRHAAKPKSTHYTAQLRPRATARVAVNRSLDEASIAGKSFSWHWFDLSITMNEVLCFRPFNQKSRARSWITGLAKISRVRFMSWNSVFSMLKGLEKR